MCILMKVIGTRRILLAAILAVFYILEALTVRNVASDTVKAAYIIWPREGWAMGMGAALLWLIISFFCCCAFLHLPLLRYACTFALVAMGEADTASMAEACSACTGHCGTCPELVHDVSICNTCFAQWLVYMFTLAFCCRLVQAKSPKVCRLSA